MTAPDGVVDQGDEAEADHTDDRNSQCGGAVAAEGAAEDVNEEIQRADAGDGDADIGDKWCDWTGFLLDGADRSGKRAPIRIGRALHDEVDENKAVEEK